MQLPPDQDRFPSRKNPRLKNFDYSSENYYFITICTWNKICIFGKGREQNAWGHIAEEMLLGIPIHFPGVRLEKYVIMPNHVHMILVLKDGSHSVSEIIGQYKSAVTRNIRKFAHEQNVWQTSFHDHVIRDQKDFERIWLYIEANPQNWEKDCFFEAL